MTTTHVRAGRLLSAAASGNGLAQLPLDDALPSAAVVEEQARAALARRRRWALVLAVAIAVLVPALYMWVEVRAGMRDVWHEADHVADDLSEIATRDPDGWSYHVGRYTLIGVKLRQHSPGAAMRVADSSNQEVYTAGEWPLRWPFHAARNIYDAGQAVGAVTIQHPTERVRSQLALVALGALLVAGLAYAMVAHVAIGDVQRQISQLRALRDAAERADSARATFLATMSHEIRTPMNGVIGLADLMSDTPLNAQQRHYVEVIRHSSEALLRVINDVLDFSRLESGRIDLEHAPYRPEALAREVAELMTALASAKGLTLEVEADAQVPAWVSGDAARLRQVLLNLVGNAIKFSTAGSVGVKLSLLAPGRLQWRVSDSGIGMSAQQQQRIFAPFVQADASVSRRFGGTGLGLAISRHLVSAMGGEFSLASQPGVGSTFSFDVQAPACEAPPAPVGDDADARAALVARGLRVLLVEDNEVNVLVASAMLERLGIKADVAADGEAALAAVLKRPYDLVLMDLAMGGMDGLEATRRIRSQGAAVRQPRIVAMTANSADHVRDECRAAGMDDYLGKPFLRSEFERVLEQAAAR